MSKSTSMDRSVPKSIRTTVLNAKKNDILGWEYPYKKKMRRKDYESKKLELQIELLKMEKWIKASGEKVVMRILDPTALRTDLTKLGFLVAGAIGRAEDVGGLLDVQGC